MQQVGLAVFAGFVAVFASLKYLVVILTDWKRRKELPMRQALKRGVRSVLETIWAIGTSYIAAGLPGRVHAVAHSAV
jgi:hypothetical protein